MTNLLRAIACLVLAVAMGSASLVAFAHGETVVGTAGYHNDTTAGELPCTECFTHHQRVCAQSCLTSLAVTPPGLPSRPAVAAGIGAMPADRMRSGMPIEPPLTPPIAA
jgi:hypothetical protein